MNDSSTEFEVEDGLPSWGMVPRAVMLDQRLSNNDRAVYAALATYANRTTREAFPKQSVLGKAIGSERTVRRSVKNLESFGLLTMRRIKGSSGQYVRTVYKMLGWGSSEATTHRPVGANGHWPVEVGVHRPVEASHRSTDHTATDQETSALRAAPTKEKRDVARARAFLDRFGAWYRRGYGRPHASPDKGQLFATEYLLRKVDRDSAKVEAISTSGAESVIGSVLEMFRNGSDLRAQVWFLRNGEPIGLDEILSTKKWAVLWDRYLQEAQRLGYQIGGDDGFSEGAGAAAG
jgi:hypothetical protein